MVALAGLMDFGLFAARGASRHLAFESCHSPIPCAVGMVGFRHQQLHCCLCCPCSLSRPRLMQSFTGMFGVGSPGPSGLRAQFLAPGDRCSCCAQTLRTPGFTTACPLFRAKAEAVGGGSPGTCGPQDKPLCVDSGRRPLGPGGEAGARGGNSRSRAAQV